MLRLRSCVLTHLLSSPATYPAKYPVSSLLRLLSAATPADPPIPSFTVEEYLVDTCGLTRPQALKASTKLSHLESPTNPDAVLAFLAGLGLSPADVSAVVVKDPRLLCADVDKTLSPVVVGLTTQGLSHAEIARLFSLGRTIFRCRSVVSNLPYYMSLLGSIKNRIRFLKNGSSLLGCSVEKVVKPNVAFLRECGLADCAISKLCIHDPRMLTTNLEHLRGMVALAEGLGVPRGSGMFRQALHAVAFLSVEKIAAKVEYLKKTFRWSDAEVSIAVTGAPVLLKKSKDSLRCTSEFFFSEVGLEPAYIARRPVMINYSLKGRLRPRYYAVKFLKENCLLERDLSYYTVVSATEKVFMENYVCPHKEAAPHLVEDYGAACRGEVPTRFRFT